MKRVFGVIVVVLGLLFFSGCTQSPQIPELPQTHSNNSPEIALRDSLTAEDARKIFEAVNRKGKLNGLKPFFENATDQDLKTLGRATNRYLYQDALNPEGFPALIEKKVFEKGFSAFAQNLLALKKSHPDMNYSALIKTTLSHPSFPKILNRNAYLFNPVWSEAITELQLPFEDVSTTLEQNSLLFNDLSKLAKNSEFEKEFIALSTSLKKTELGRNTFMAFRQLREEKGTGVFVPISEALKISLSPQQDKRSTLSRFLTLAQSLNRPSQGLFTEAQATLKTEEGQSLIRLLSERFEPWILKGAAGYIRETLTEPFDDITLDNKFWLELPRKEPSEPPTPNLIHLTQRIQYALDKMANTSRPLKDPNVTLNSFLLAKWFEQFAKENKETFKELNQENFWNHSLKPFVFSLNLIELDEKGKPKKDNDQKLILSSKIEGELKALGLEDFANELKEAIKQNSFGPTSFKLALDSGPLTLKSALADSVTSLHQAHPIGDPVPLITSLAYLFTRNEIGASFHVSDLESPNMLSSLQSFIKGLSYPTLHKLVNFLFEDLSLGTLSPEDIERLKSLYPQNPKAAQLLETVLQNLETIHELDSISADIPGVPKISLLEVYHTLLVNSRARDIQGLNSLFNFLSKTQLLEGNQQGFEYPSVPKALSSKASISQTLKALSEANPTQEQAVLLLINSIFGTQEKDISELFSFFKDVILKHDSSLTSWAQAQNQGSINFNLSYLEKKWLFQLFSSDDFLDLYQVLLKLNDSQNLLQLASNLEQLEQEGDLEDIIKILGNFKSDKMQRLALVLWDWEKSKELNVFFSLIKSLTRG